MTEGRRLAAVVLAAGKGTRMRSETTKVLHPFLGRPMVAWSVEAAFGAGCTRVAVVVGHQGDAVRHAVIEAFPSRDVVFVEQVTQRGTGDAVRCALPAIEGCDTLMIISGDTPALDSETLLALAADHASQSSTLTVASFEAADPTGYGRIVRDANGTFVRIVEHADATAEERAITDVNAGLYMAECGPLADALASLDSNNAQGELYVTDAAALARDAGHHVTAWQLSDPLRVAGVNTRAHLAALEGEVHRRQIQQRMLDGVTFEAPDSVRVEAQVFIDADTRIGADVELRGATRIGKRCRIERGCVLTDCTVGDDVHIKPYVVGTEAILEHKAIAGPFAHLRPATRLAEGAKVGNFVETKKTTLGPGSKANHLTYLGDCEVGRGVNIGAGTITCNYDGADKHKTVLEDGVFIGSDTQLVAPVRVGKNATVGAGTTVTRDVPEGALVLSRTAQREVAGYYEKRRRPREEAKRLKKEATARDAQGAN
ncbi:MAG: bifunctional UDP-N-acetylglucosamine pyrophosphorylase/glucosamine-1-phosphate N-acetyltransferase [Myxococcota bacterium]|jgi:bifunctional UDP-N-acetylglucosamine pyrophosphorylase/glucosamine-1-phosphate N-acetyltransferase